MNSNETDRSTAARCPVLEVKDCDEKSTAQRPPRKWQRVLQAFVDGRSLNRFDAERVVHDHALHSTVAGLQSRGLIVHRRDETVPGFRGIPTHMTRYWLAPESFDRARELLTKRAPREVARDAA